MGMEELHEIIERLEKLYRLAERNKIRFGNKSQNLVSLLNQTKEKTEKVVETLIFFEKNQRNIMNTQKEKIKKFKYIELSPKNEKEERLEHISKFEKVDNLEPIKEEKSTGPIEYFSEEEFEKIPHFLKGKFTKAELNKRISYFNKVFSNKKEILSKNFTKLSAAEKQRYI